MNIIGTHKVIDLAKKCKQLEVLVHVSTAYANCDRSHISEVVYNPPVRPERLIEAMEWMDGDLVDTLTPKIIKSRPNTYTFTKAVAEYLVLRECKEGGVPCAIVRPSIVGASWREPFPGWIDNFNGPTALFAAIGKGILRTMMGNSNSTADLIPVDVTVNFLIASAWYTGTRRPADIKVYNNTTGQIKRLTWGMLERFSHESLTKNPLENVFLVPDPRFTSYKSIKLVRHMIEEVLPSYIMDLYLKLANRKTLFVRLQSRIQKAVQTLEFFTSTQWEFTNDNFYAIMSEMNEVDNKVGFSFFLQIHILVRKNLITQKKTLWGVFRFSIWM
jgi:fatty acyl-CoA reductase